MRGSPAASEYGSLAGMQNALAQDILGFPGGYSVLDTISANRLDRAIDLGMDRLLKEDEFQSEPLEGGFNTVAPITGTDGVVNQGVAQVDSAAATFQADGVAAEDRIQIGVFDVAARISAVPSETQLTLKDQYPGANATGQSYEVIRDEYALGAGVWKILEMWTLNDAGGAMIPVNAMRERARGNDAHSTGRPNRFIMADRLGTEDRDTVGMRVRFFPAPDAIYTVRYRYQEIPSWPTGSDFHTAPLVQRALYYACCVELLMLSKQFSDVKGYSDFYKDELRNLRKLTEGMVDDRVVLEDTWSTGHEYPFTERAQDL